MSHSPQNTSKFGKIKWLKWLFFALIAKPLVLIMLGLNIIHRERLPLKGPAVIVANHTSHLDTLVLMSLYPLTTIQRIRPVAAADYFMKNRYMRWFSTHCIDIIPLDRHGIKAPHELFAKCHEALANHEILILFPEGTRSMTEERDFKLKRGIHLLISKHPEIPVTPLILRGLGKALPKGEALFVPFNCDVIIGEPLAYNPDAKAYLQTLEAQYHELLTQTFTHPSPFKDNFKDHT